MKLANDVRMRAAPKKPKLEETKAEEVSHLKERNGSVVEIPNENESPRNDL